MQRFLQKNKKKKQRVTCFKMIVATDPGIIYPEVYDMQVEAIMTAVCEVVKKKVIVEPEIMIPLVGRVRELEFFFHTVFLL